MENTQFPNLMYYIILMYGAGIVIDLVSQDCIYQNLCLDAAAILRGQVWRLVTFLICPPSSGIFFKPDRHVFVLFAGNDAGTGMGNLPL